jgi:hypothetical protein
MRYAGTVAAVVVAVTCSIAAGQSQAGQGQPLATGEELRQMFEARQYHLCLQQIARVMRAKPPVSAQFAGELQLMRGECYMQLQDRAHAFKAFGEAQGCDDPKVALTARANYLMLQASTGLQYNSESGTIDLVNPESRRKAMYLLYGAERRKAEPAIARAKGAQTMEPILAAVPKLKDLTALELTATGDDKDILPAFSAVGARARDLISAALGPMDGQISEIERRANEPVTGVVAGGWWVNAGRRGLDTPDRAALEQLLKNAGQAHAMALSGVVTAKALKGNVGQWEQLASSTGAVVDHARNVLDAE